MSAPTRQRSFSAKSQPESRLGPPKKKKFDLAVREYLRPDEEDARQVSGNPAAIGYAMPPLFS